MTYHELLSSSLARGLPIEKALELLRSGGASPMEAACAVQRVTGVPLQEARELVARTRKWSVPRSGPPPGHPPRAVDGSVGHHGRSGHGAASVLPHLLRQQAGHEAGS